MGDRVFYSQTAEDAKLLRDEIVRVAREIVGRNRGAPFTMPALMHKALSRIHLGNELHFEELYNWPHRLRASLDNVERDVRANNGLAIVCIDRMAGLWKRVDFCTGAELDTWAADFRADVTKARAKERWALDIVDEIRERRAMPLRVAA